MSAVSDGPHAEPIDIETLLKRRVEAQIVQPATAAEGAASSDALLSALASAESSAAPMPAPASSVTIDAPDPLPLARPEFVRRAERDARWRSPAMRGALSVISVVLLLLLGAQVAYHHRDELAARSPWAADLLGAACARFATV